ncbi:hypothetical protein Trydic_g4267 [Trypoxylus dichotomus]
MSDVTAKGDGNTDDGDFPVEVRSIMADVQVIEVFNQTLYSAEDKEASYVNIPVIHKLRAQVLKGNSSQNQRTSKASSGRGNGGYVWFNMLGKKITGLHGRTQQFWIKKITSQKDKRCKTAYMAIAPIAIGTPNLEIKNVWFSMVKESICRRPATTIRRTEQ